MFSEISCFSENIEYLLRIRERINAFSEHTLC